MRKLLPYEHQLIETLGITEEEYWQFYLAQQKYADAKAGTVLDIRNEVLSTIALVLSIVGTIAQVAGALLAPKPESNAAVAKRTRNTIFAPRYGFNSFQEVARYGEPVNLIYTNRDENTLAGGLRVNTSLVWSAVQSFGTSQYIQMQAVVGAGEIEQFAYGRTAFGQATLRDFASQRFWLYSNNSGGPLTFGNFQSVQGGSSSYDPSSDGQSTGNYIYRASKGGLNIVEGFSQAFSPSANNTLGLYNVIPINVQVLERDEEGNIRKNDRDDLGIEIRSRGIDGTNYWPGDWAEVYGTGPRPSFPAGKDLKISFKEDDATANNRINTDAEEAALNYRVALISTIDSASIYKLGAAKFQLIGVDKGSATLAESKFEFRCVEPGVLCEEDYDIKSYLEKEEDLEEDLKRYKASLVDLDTERANWSPLISDPAAKAEYDNLTAEKEGLDDQIEGASAILDGDINSEDLDKVYDAAKAAGAFPGITRAIDGLDDTIETKEERIEDLTDAIAEERQKAEPDQGQISDWREKRATRRREKRDLNKEKKDLLGKLANRVLKYSLYQGNSTALGRADLRGERKILKRKRRALEQQLAELSKTFVDKDGEAARLAEWTQRYESIQQEITIIEKQLRNPESFNDHFNVKCLAKIDEITYSTITNCDIVDLALKSKVFKRIAGRQSVYGENKEQKHKDSDNGLRLRTAMFWVLYKKTGDPDYRRVKAIFAIRKGVEVDNYTGIRFVLPERAKWTFKMEPIIDLAAELRTHTGGQDINVAYLETRIYKNSRQNQSVQLDNGGSIQYYGKDLIKTKNRLLPQNNNPGFVDEWGVFSMRSDTQISFSFDSGPEIALMAATEQQVQAFVPGLYQGLSMLGFNAYSGKGVQDLRSLSAYVLKGKKVRKIDDNGNYGGISTSTSYAPEIFLDTILDEENGIGAYANINGIDLPSLGLAMKFCKANNYHMDCVIAEPGAWREFWATVAPFSLLEFAKIGGREALLPAVPYDTYGNVSNVIAISALFNQGNILEDSYKEEFIDYGDNTEDLIATIVYRGTEDDDSFATNTSVEIRLADADEASCIRQTFDLSNFVSRRSQAINYGMLLCQQRRHSRRAVEFKTFPTESPVAPGSYIYVQTDQNQWDSLTSGTIEANGQLNLPLTEAITSASREALIYKGGQGVRSLGTISIENNASEALLAYAGWLIVLGNQITSKRVFRVTEVAMEEEGEVTIKAAEHPCEETAGQTLSKIVRFDPNLFLIQ